MTAQANGDMRRSASAGPPLLTAAPTARHAAASPPRAVRARAAHGNGGWLLAVASGLLFLLAAAQGYVSFRAQYAFVDHAKRAHIPSLLEALGLDTGAVIFALLALSLARRGQRGTAERILNVACALGSLTMNLLAANLASPRSVTVWVLPSALYALASDRLIAVVRRWAQAMARDAQVAPEGSPWRALGGLALWVLRLALDAPGTVTGFRRWVLAAAPVAPGIRAVIPSATGGLQTLPAGDDGDGRNSQPIQNAGLGATGAGEPHEPPGQSGPPAQAGPARFELAPGENKREALIRLYEQSGQAGDPRYGNRAKAASLAGELAAEIGYHPGTARRELVRYLTAQLAAVPTPESVPGPDAEAVA
jgi:hypothetical protein